MTDLAMYVNQSNCGCNDYHDVSPVFLHNHLLEFSAYNCGNYIMYVAFFNILVVVMLYCSALRTRCYLKGAAKWLLPFICILLCKIAK